MKFFTIARAPLAVDSILSDPINTHAGRSSPDWCLNNQAFTYEGVSSSPPRSSERLLMLSLLNVGAIWRSLLSDGYHYGHRDHDAPKS